MPQTNCRQISSIEALERLKTGTFIIMQVLEYYFDRKNVMIRLFRSLSFSSSDSFRFSLGHLPRLECSLVRTRIY